MRPCLRTNRFGRLMTLSPGIFDDLDAELDRERLGLAVALFADAPQILATSSRPEVFAGRAPGVRWSLARGVIQDSSANN